MDERRQGNELRRSPRIHGEGIKGMPQMRKGRNGRTAARPIDGKNDEDEKRKKNVKDEKREAFKRDDMNEHNEAEKMNQSEKMRDKEEGRTPSKTEMSPKQANGAQKLWRVRMQRVLVQRLAEQIEETEMDTLHSVKLDGMPKGSGGVPHGLDVKLARRESLMRLAQREGALLRRYEREARREMDAMKPEHYAFCALYYLAALSMEDTAQTLDRSIRQCARYKREIEGEQ